MPAEFPGRKSIIAFLAAVRDITQFAECPLSGKIFQLTACTDENFERQTSTREWRFQSSGRKSAARPGGQADRMLRSGISRRSIRPLLTRSVVTASGDTRNLSAASSLVSSE